MENNEKRETQSLLLRDVPSDVVRELDARAELNYRSRSSEILAILTAVCRGHVALPVSMAPATVAASKPQGDDLPEPDQGVAAQESAGGEACK